ncbi:hypothetical protein BKA82DRAFT_3011380 [Pisolithus tinctorius]|nr:hypothetical protein BKA82DRAFT_3011380 [Pisolithus tinctorius]
MRCFWDYYTVHAALVFSAFTSLVGVCMAEDECQAQIPFTGTGITIYVLNAGFQRVNASLSVGTLLVNGTLQPPSPPSFQTPRVSLLAIQSLPYAYYIATLSILDWASGATSLYFDYALIEDSIVQTTTSPPSTLTTAISASPPPASPITMPTTTLLPTASTTEASGSSSSISSCTSCLRAIEIAIPCATSTLLAAGVILYLKSRGAKTKKEADNRVPEPFTDVRRSPLPLTPASEERARMRAAQSRTPEVHTEMRSSDRPSTRDGLLSGCSSDVGRESRTSGGNEDFDELQTNDRARSAPLAVGLPPPLSDNVAALQSSPTQSSSARSPRPGYK